MMTPKIGPSRWLQIDTTRPRETPRPAMGFREVLREGGKLLLAGAQVAGGLVGGPLLSAAVARLSPGLEGASPATASGSTLEGGGTADSLKAMQRDRMGEELQLLALQSEIQRQDRQVSLTSNLMKARHDTAKQAISNIRS